MPLRWMAGRTGQPIWRPGCPRPWPSRRCRLRRIQARPSGTTRTRGAVWPSCCWYRQVRSLAKFYSLNSFTSNWQYRDEFWGEKQNFKKMHWWPDLWIDKTWRLTLLFLKNLVSNRPKYSTQAHVEKKTMVFELDDWPAIKFHHFPRSRDVD